MNVFFLFWCYHVVSLFVSYSFFLELFYCAKLFDQHVLFSSHYFVPRFVLNMPLCVGYSSTPCPLEANIGVGRKRCKRCKRLAFMQCNGGRGHQQCSSILFDKSPTKLMLCLGDATGRPCSHSAYVLKKNQRCKECRKSVGKSTFLDFLQNGKHCCCKGCSGCDWMSWWNRVDESSKEKLIFTNCSRPIASRKKHKYNHDSGLCAFCTSS